MNIVSALKSEGLKSCLVIRLISIVITALFYTSLSLEHFYSIYLAFSFAHYVGGVYYARGQMRKVFSDKRSKRWFMVLIPLGVVLFFAGLSPVLFFGLHHVLSEVYLANRAAFHGEDAVKEKKPLLSGSRLLLHSFCFLYLIRFDPHNRAFYAFLPDPIMKWGIALSAGFFLWQAMRTLSMKKNNDSLVKILAFETVTMGIWAGLLLGAKGAVELEHIIFYHGFCWFLYPIPKLLKSPRKKTVQFLTFASLVSFIPLCFTPLGASLFSFLEGPWIMSNMAMLICVFFGGYLHISLSFALSTANPLWVRRIFHLTPLPVSIPASVRS